MQATRNIATTYSGPIPFIVGSSRSQSCSRTAAARGPGNTFLVWQVYRQPGKLSIQNSTQGPIAGRYVGVLLVWRLVRPGDSGNFALDGNGFDQGGDITQLQ